MKKLIIVALLVMFSAEASAIVVNPARPVNACSSVANPKPCK